MKVNRFLSSYLRAADVTEDIVVTIEKVEAVSFENEGTVQEKLAVTGRELEQDIVLNKTMIRQLTEILASDDTEDWQGKKVVLYTDPDVFFQGKRTGGLRFRALKSTDTPF